MKERETIIFYSHFRQTPLISSTAQNTHVDGALKNPASVNGHETQFIREWEKWLRNYYFTIIMQLVQKSNDDERERWK